MSYPHAVSGIYLYDVLLSYNIHYEVADLSRNHDKNYTRHDDNMPGDEKPHGAGWLV
jgi:hypothetical protein